MTMRPDALQFSAVIDAVAQRMGARADGGVFWFQALDQPPITVELLPDPPSVLLYAVIARGISQHEGLTGAAFSLLEANTPDTPDRGNYLGINPVEDTLLFFTRLGSSALAATETAMEAMLRFSSEAARAMSRMPPGMRARLEAADDGGEEFSSAEVEENRKAFAGIWSDLARTHGLDSGNDVDIIDVIDVDAFADKLLEGKLPGDIRALESDTGTLLLIECEAARGTVLLSAVLGYLPLMDLDGDDGDHSPLRKLLESHVGGMSTNGGVFALNKYDELVLHRRLPLEGLDALDLWNAAEALASSAAHYSGELGLEEAMAA